MSIETQFNGMVDQDAVSVGATATALITTAGIPGKPWKGIYVTPTDGDIYWGGPDVTTTNGQPQFANQKEFIPMQRAGNLHAIRAAAADVDVRVTPVY